MGIDISSKREQPVSINTGDKTSSQLARGKLGILNHDLSERVKELNCLYGISRLFEGKNASIDDTLQSVVNLIPPAWQYPEITCSRIKLKKAEYKTSNFRETNWRQTQKIKVNGRQYGTVEVYYLDRKSESDEGPFLKEERNLLRVIAERLGILIESQIAKVNLESSYKRERELREKLQIEMNSKVDLTRKLIHELKTPLTSLIATSQLLYDEAKDKRLGKLARYILDGANNMNRRIEELHDVTRGEIGQLKLTLKKVNIVQFLNFILEEVQQLAKQNEMSVELKISEHLPEITIDPDRIHQVILNLINNAFKYAREGKKVTIRVTEQSGYIMIDVRDYGPGIPLEKQGTLFEPGYQVAYREERSGGLGIGLSLCKLLVGLHGGKIWAKSRVGKGTSFIFTLPVKPSEQ
jgi:signal transduction histidine kinase